MDAVSTRRTNFLDLPAELRNRIYEDLCTPDLELFVERQTQPALLKTSHQLRKEYSSIFFSNESLKFDAYIGIDNSWQQVLDKETKRMILERGVLSNLVDFWSLASARRHCQRRYSDWQGNLQLGIMTVFTRAGIRRWLWCIAHVD